MLYKDRLYTADDSEAGEAHYAVLIEPREIIWTGDGRKWRVLAVVPNDEPDELGYVGFLRVEAA